MFYSLGVSNLGRNWERTPIVCCFVSLLITFYLSVQIYAVSPYFKTVSHCPYQEIRNRFLLSFNRGANGCKKLSGDSTPLFKQDNLRDVVGWIIF